MARLGLRHDVDVPLPRQLADLLGLGSRNVNAARASVVGMIHVQHFIIESHQRAFRNGEQTHRNIEIGKPERRLGETFEVLDVVFDFLAPANTPKTGDEADGIIWLDHRLPLRSRFPRLTNYRNGSRCDARKPRQRHGKLLFVVVLVDKFAFEVVDIGLHVEMPVTREIEEDRLFLALLLAAQRLVDGAPYRVRGLRSRHNALTSRKFYTGLETGELMVSARFDQAEFVNVGHER